MDRNLFCFWTANNPMPTSRYMALLSMDRSGLNVVFITPDRLHEWVLEDYPLHPAYKFLSAIHRADYLRVYFMHHYGGGYSDIKYINDSWVNEWEKLINSDKWAVGYREIGPRGVARVPSFNYIKLLFYWRKLIGNGAYIFKSHTSFTKEWLDSTNKLLDKKIILLKKYPAKVPEDYYGRYIDGIKSQYPLYWSELLGNIFHPICLKYASKINYELCAPDLKSNYD